jgi:hypothetical protein
MTCAKTGLRWTEIYRALPLRHLCRGIALAVGLWATLAVGPTAYSQSHPPITELAITNGTPITITNNGSQTVKAVIIAWNGTDPAPVSVECTGFIPPAGQWPPPGQWTYAPGAYLGAPAMDRVKVFSFNTKTLLDAGINPGTLGDDLVSDRMCENLFFHARLNAGDFQAFEQAFVAGTIYREIDQSKAWGSTLQVQTAPTVTHAGAISLDSALPKRVPAAVLNAAAAKPESISGYGQAANPNIPVGPMNAMRTCLTLVDRGKPWHPLFNGLVFKAGCQ